MVDKENVDVNANKTIQDKSKNAESSKQRLPGDKLPKEPLGNVELRKQLNEQNERIIKFVQYGETVEKLGTNLQKFIDDFVAGLRVPIDLQMPKPATTTALPSASATVSPPSAADKRPSLVEVELTPNQTLHLHLQPNADVEVVEHGKYCKVENTKLLAANHIQHVSFCFSDNTISESFRITQHAATDDSEWSQVERIAQKIVTRMPTDDVHQLVNRIIELVRQKEARVEENTSSGKCFPS